MGEFMRYREGSMSWMMTSEGEDESFVQAMLFTNAHVLSLVLKAAVELNLFDIIAQAAGDGGAYISPSEVASHLPTQNPDAASLVDRMLRLLAAHGLLHCSLRDVEDDVERVYALTPTGKFYLKSDEDGASLASMVTHISLPTPGLLLGISLKDVVLEGGNVFERVHGMRLYERMEKDPARSQSFNRAMAGRSLAIMKKIVEIYRGFEGLSSLVDVGGGTGTCLNVIVSRHPSIKGINFDLPHVLQTAPTYPGVEHVEGNMFASIPEADAIMLKDVCHNWSDEDCLKILRNCYKALPEKGKVIVIELVMAEVAETGMGCQYATRVDNMMIMLCGGRERTAREFEVLCMASGFSHLRLLACAYNCLWSVLEFHKS